MASGPFDSLESAHQYVALLASEVEAVTAGIEQDICTALEEQATRRVDALRLVDYKLRQLAAHLQGSRAILNDLRMLRRLLVVDNVDSLASR